MRQRIVGRLEARLFLWFTLALLGALAIAAPSAASQRGFGRGGGRGGPPPTAREAAPVDLTGYWVSIVTEDWIERMSPDSPPSGTGGRGGLGAAGGAPAPPANADPCRVYGAGGSMRVPGRLHITWTDDTTLQVETDAGTQTRVFHFDPSGPAPTDNTLQGYSVAEWQTGGGGGRGRGGRGGGGNDTPRWGSLKVVTTNMTGGYLLSSRSSYSDDAVLTEYFMPHSDFGEDYLTVTAVIEDGGTLVTSSTFKKEPDGARFSPSGCEVVR